MSLAGERRRKSYQVTEGLATGLLLLVFVLATWFVLLTALNVSGNPLFDVLWQQSSVLNSSLHVYSFLVNMTVKSGFPAGT
jgi:hypothetical protein